MSLLPSDMLTRFVRHNSHCKNNKVTSDVFIPPHHSIDTSVYITEGLPEHRIWDIAKTLTKPTVARADMEIGNARINGLDVIPSEPPPKHANITPFPELPDPTCPQSEVNLTERKARRVLADKLANRSNLVRSPTKIIPSKKV